MVVQRNVLLSHPSFDVFVFAEEAYREGWQEEEAGPEVHAGLYPPCRGWHHGRCQLCTYTQGSAIQRKQLLCYSVIHAYPQEFNEVIVYQV